LLRGLLSDGRYRFAAAAAVLAVGTVPHVPVAAGQPTSPPAVVKTRRALDALGSAAVAWQTQFNCSGCHKQTITLSALAEASARGHAAAPPGVVDTLAQGLLSGGSGQDQNGCFSFAGQRAFAVATSFGGRAVAALHRGLRDDLGPNLLAASDCLLARRETDGRVASDHTELPVAQGDFMTTSNAVLAWNRAAEISANGSYATARDEAVAWLRSRIAAVETTPASFTTQDKAMLLAGLGHSGAGSGDPDVIRMRDLLAGEQLADGSWPLSGSSGGGNAFATGQVVFSFRAVGLGSPDAALDLGMQWLLDHQLADGSWAADHWEGNGPSQVVPSMWAAAALATLPSPLATLRVTGGVDSVVSWSDVEGAEGYDLIRGAISDLVELGDDVDLGVAVCLAPAATSTSTQDFAVPAVGEARFYVMRIRWGSEADICGRSTAGLDRIAVGGCPP